MPRRERLNLKSPFGNSADSQRNQIKTQANTNDGGESNSLQNQSPTQANMNDDTIDDFNMNGIPRNLQNRILEDEELIPRDRPETNEEDGANLNRRLLAPPSEIRHRYRQLKSKYG